MTSRKIWLAIDIGLKLGLVGLLLLAVLFPHLPQFEGKAMGGRALVYPLSTLTVPVAWFMSDHRLRRRRGRATGTRPAFAPIAGPLPTGEQRASHQGNPK